MSRLTWDTTGTRKFETGVKNCVLYKKGTTSPYYSNGVAWNGITGITETPSGADVTDLWADDTKYASLRASETFGGTIEAYTYPDEWMDCDGSKGIASHAGVSFGQQKREYFGLTYRTQVGNDVDPELGYKLHLVYNCSASPSDRSYATVNDSPDAISFSWEFTTTNEPITGHENDYKSTALITIDSTKITDSDKAKLTQLEDILYGTDAHQVGGETIEATNPRLPSPVEVYNLFAGVTPEDDDD